MTVLLQRKRQIAAAIESTEGTAESLSNSNANHLVLADDLSYTPDVTMHERNIAQSSLSRWAKLPGVELGAIACSVELRGSGTANTVPSWDTLLRPCGFARSTAHRLQHAGITGTFAHGEEVQSSGDGVGRVVGTYAGSEDVYVIVTSGTFGDTETITGQTSSATATLNAAGADTGYVYEPASSSIPSLTLAMYHDGTRKLLKGARGNVQFVGEVGQPARMVFNYIGVYEAPTDLALLSGITYESTLPPVLKGTNLEFGSFSPVCESFSLDMQNEVEPRTSMGASQGAISSRIVSRMPTGTFNPEMDLVANFDFYGRYLGATLHRTEFDVGSAAGNRFKFAMPQSQIETVGEGERNGLSVVDLGLGFVGQSAYQDQEISLLVF